MEGKSGEQVGGALKLHGIKPTRHISLHTESYCALS